MTGIAHVLVIFLLSASSFCQLPSKYCDSAGEALEHCPYLTQNEPAVFFSFGNSHANDNRETGAASPGPFATSAGASDAGVTENLFAQQSIPKKQGFRWGRALFESFTFLAIEQAYVVHDDYRWIVAENGIPFNHYWRDYKQSLSTWVHSGWDDGDPALYSYVGHPIQGAMVSYIQIQNDPKGENLEFSNTREYWHSRLKATVWNAVYSTQWNIGPLSELTVEKYGTKVRPRWNTDGSWPCRQKHCFSGVGQVDLVITPIGGLGWLLAEDWLDKNIARRVEGGTRNRFLIDVTRCAVAPIRGGANILHGRRPWYRARDARQIYLTNQLKKVSGPQPPDEL